MSLEQQLFGLYWNYLFHSMNWLEMPRDEEKCDFKIRGLTVVGQGTKKVKKLELKKKKIFFGLHARTKNSCKKGICILLILKADKKMDGLSNDI